jgi:hypothetical protein
MSRWIKFAVSLGITIVCLWWTFRDTDFEAMMVSLRSANWLMLLPYLGLLCVIHVARTLRWGNLLSGMEVVPFKKLNEASAIGFMMLIILPFRLGEFARPLLIAQRSHIRRSAAMTSVVLERIVDGVIIAILLRALMFFIPGESEGISRIRVGANLMFLVFGSGLVFLLLARWQHDRVVGILRATLGKIAPGPTEKFVFITDGFVSALKQLPDGRNKALFAFWTAVYWVCNGVGMSLLANAFDCSGGTAANCSPLHITTFQGYVVLCVLIVGMMIPAAPGSAGTFQAFILLALGVFVPGVVVNSSGVAYANVLWVVQIVQQIAFGLIFLVASHSSFSDIAGKLSGPEVEQSGEA